MTITQLLHRAVQFDAGDARRVQHFIKVHSFAALIGRMEGLPEGEQQVLEAAAVLHDIGIHAAEEKHGSTAGPYQELEGPSIARAILQEFGCDEAFVSRVCFLVGHHHTYTMVDGRDYQILLEADFLVNAYEDNLSPEAIAHAASRVFKTKSGLALLHDMYL